MDNFEQLWQDGPYFRQADHFKLGTDSVLLSDFVNTTTARNGIDLGCASGAIALLLLCKSEKLHMTGLELQPQAAELARDNMSVNGFSERSEIICGDIRRCRELFKTGSFDLVVANPPYFPVGSGKQASDSARAHARSEEECTMEDICSAAAYLCPTGGSVYFVHKPERLSELMSIMSAKGIEPKRLRLVCRDCSSAPNLVLVHGRRGGKPGLIIEPALFLVNSVGKESEEVKRIYRR